MRQIPDPDAVELRGCTGLPDYDRDSRRGPDGRVYEGYFPGPDGWHLADGNCWCGIGHEVPRDMDDELTPDAYHFTPEPAD